jgi:hypothetical protein
VVSSGTTEEASGAERAKAVTAERRVVTSPSLRNAMENSGDFSAIAQKA